MEKNTIDEQQRSCENCKYDGECPDEYRRTQSNCCENWERA